jgi:hypothetical protein
MALVARWHAPGSAYGWALIEGNDTTALAQHVAEWANYLQLRVTPVMEDGKPEPACRRRTVNRAADLIHRWSTQGGSRLRSPFIVTFLETESFKP